MLKIHLVLFMLIRTYNVNGHVVTHKILYIHVYISVHVYVHFSTGLGVLDTCPAVLAQQAHWKLK